MPATKRGIYHNLRESEYTVSNGEITLFFSSKLYLKNYLDKYKDNRKNYEGKMKKLKLNLETVADMNLYMEIERRGFYILLKGVRMDWHEVEKYALRKMISKNTNDWFEAPRIKLGERVKSMESI